jgi:hypothetical protein
MRPAGSLERGYRRLLRCYPEGHRDRHGDEMLGVLLSAARAGQRRPGLAESANLVAGAVRIRLRGTSPGSASQWRDSLAQASLVLPLLLAAAALTQLALYEPGGQQPALARLLAPHLYLIPWGSPVWWPVVPLAVLAVPAVLGWRLGTAAVTLLLSVFCVIEVGSDVLAAQRGLDPAFVQPANALCVAVLAIEAVALAASPGTRRGRDLLSRRHYFLITAAGAAIGAAGTAGWWQRRLLPHGDYTAAFRSPRAALALGGLVVTIAAAMLIRRAASRRLLVTLALPAYFYVLNGIYGTSIVPGPPPAFLLPLALLPPAVILMILRRYRRRRAPADGQDA